MHKVFGNIAHHFERELGAEQAGVLALVFFQNIGLHRAAHVLQHPFFDLGSFGLGGFAAIVGFEFIDVLVDGGIHEHRQNRRGRTIDGHRHAGGRIA